MLEREVGRLRDTNRSELVKARAEADQFRRQRLNVIERAHANRRLADNWVDW